MNNLKVTRKRNLVLMTSVALIVLMAVSVVSAWSLTGKATDSNTIYTIYQGKSKDISVGENSYKIAVKVVSSSSRALLNIDGIQYEITTGINQIGNIQINVDLISPKKSLKKAFVKFSVSEVEIEEFNGSDLLSGVAYKPVPGERKLSGEIYFQDTTRDGKFDQLILYYRGTNWDCREEFTDLNGAITKKARTYIKAGMETAGLPEQIVYGWKDVNKDGEFCVLVANHPDTGSKEFVVSTSDYLRGRNVAPSDSIKIDMSLYEQGVGVYKGRYNSEGKITGFGDIVTIEVTPQETQEAK